MQSPLVPLCRATGSEQGAGTLGQWALCLSQSWPSLFLSPRDHRPPSGTAALGRATAQEGGPVWEIGVKTVLPHKEKVLFMFSNFIMITFELFCPDSCPEEAGRYFPIRSDKGGRIDQLLILTLGARYLLKDLFHTQQENHPSLPLARVAPRGGNQ